MEEINDFIMYSLYSALFKDVKKSSQSDAEYENKYKYLNKNSKPEDFQISTQQFNSFNQPMWLKAIIELEKIDKYKTPSLKMK